jgi:hypothetical protein
MLRIFKQALLILILLFLLSGCSSAGSGNAVLGDINCHVSYRPSAGESLVESPLLTLSADGDSESIPFEALEFRAQFLSDAFEGQSLSIVVTDSGTQREITRALYQIDPKLGLSNQFVGGHGFTGLAYVFHPKSEAEMQYFCDVG